MLIEAIQEKIQNAPVIPPKCVYITDDADAKTPCILIVENVGYPDPDLPVFHEAYQILVRAASQPEARKLADRCYSLIINFKPHGTYEHVYDYPNMTQYPAFLGRDDKKRYVYSFNFTYTTTRKEYL